MSDDVAGRLAYLAETVAVLWPQPDGRRRVVLPARRAPRVLVPAQPSRAAAQAVRTYTAQLGRADRSAGLVVAGGARAGVCRLLPSVTPVGPATDPDTIDTYLGQVLGQPVVTSLAITRSRPNRKPVLQVFGLDGRVLAFAKIGVSALAGRLVDDEARALATLRTFAEPGGALRVPAVLHHGRWHGYPVLAMSPLPAGRAVGADDALLIAAMRKVAEATSGGSTNSDVSDYVVALRERAAAADSRPHVDTWQHLFDDLVRTRDLGAVPMGAWHGDWTQWNCARTAREVVVWDWERFTHPVPVGFDRLHFVLNTAVGPRRTGFPEQTRRLVDEAEGLLGPLALAPETARTVTLLYLMDLGLRYLADDVRAADAGGAVENWAFPAVRSTLMRTDSKEGPRR